MFVITGMPSSCNAQVLRVRVSYLFRYGHRTQGLSWKKGNEQRDRVFTSSSCKQARRGMPATKVKTALQNGKHSLLHRAPNVATDEEMDARCASLSTSCEPHRYPPPLPSSLPQEPRANGDGQGEEVIR